jgi:hypothetical protein
MENDLGHTVTAQIASLSYTGAAAPNPILWDSSRSMGQNEKGLRLQPLDLTGAPGEIRTPDLLVRSQR